MLISSQLKGDTEKNDTIKALIKIHKAQYTWHNTSQTRLGAKSLFKIEKTHQRYLVLKI